MHELEIDPEEMRRLGYEAIDRLVEWQIALRDRPVWNGAQRPEMESLIARAQPEHAQSDNFTGLLDHLFDDVIPRGARTDHPRFFAFVPGNGTWPSVLGDLIAAGTDVFQGTWLASAGVSQLELRVLEWFASWLGMPSSASGLLVSGGSVANLTALACARQLRFGGHDASAVMYMSAEAHSSLARAARVLGFADHQLRVVPIDSEQRLDMDALRQLVAQDRAASLQPFLVVGNAGTTSTGSVDPLEEIARFCRAESLWFHVDAAYGGFAALTERGRSLLAGIEHADSVTLDPHKWLYQTFETGCLMVRDGRLLRAAFHVMPDYLKDTAVSDDAGAPVNFAERGIQLTRYARVIKVWLSLSYFGVDAFRRTIDRTMDLALAAEARITRDERFELITRARLGIVCFRRRPNIGADVDERRIEQMNENLLRRLMLSGLGMVSSTRVNGRYALRLCVLSYRTTESDVMSVLDWLAESELDGI